MATREVEDVDIADSAGAFYSQFSEANQDRARRMYRLKEAAADGRIEEISVCCTIHEDDSGGPIILETILPREFRVFLENTPSIECPRGDTVVPILPEEMEPSPWQKASPWERYVIIAGSVFLAFLLIFFGVRAGIRIVRSIGASPAKYQKAGQREGIIGEFQGQMAHIESLIREYTETEEDLKAVSPIPKKIKMEKGDLVRKIGQAKLRDRALLKDRDVLEIERKLKEIRL